MVEDDTFTYHVKQQPREQAGAVAPSLITKERTQKLDLLIHLLSNLNQALVVCGPEGIGKTTLLSILQQRKTEVWRYCLIQGHADLSFEAIVQQLAKSAQALGRHDGQHKQLVLVVDNAGELVPGLIAAIIQYAAANPILRVVFALTHDELQVKRGSDRAIDDCHIVELPPLSEKQCGDFLRHLSTKPSANVSFKAVGENMTTHIYRETHGVPGRIIAEVSGLSGTKRGGKLKWLLALAAATACVIAFGVQWLIASKNDAKKSVAPIAVEQKTVVLPPPTSQIMLSLPPAPPVEQAQEQTAPANTGNVPGAVAEIKTSKDEQQAVVAKPETNQEKSAPTNKPLATDTPPPSVIAPQLPKTELPTSIPSPTQPVPTEVKQENAQQTILPNPENPKNKAQSEPVAAPSGEHKQIDIAPQKIVEPLGIRPEKPKAAEPKKPVNSPEPVSSNKVETIQLPQKPVDVLGVPEQPVAEALVPQQDKPAVFPEPSASGFTLQVMVLSKQASVNAILKKYPAMDPDFRVVKTIAKGQEKFILEYGAYPDAESANKAKQSLPFEFHNAMVRKIGPTKR